MEIISPVRAPRKRPSVQQIRALHEFQNGTGTPPGRKLDEAPSGTRFIVVCRESTEEQRPNMVAQVRAVSEAAKAAGHRIVDTVEVVCPGTAPEATLANAVDVAKQYGAGILFECPSRAQRSYHFAPREGCHDNGAPFHWPKGHKHKCGPAHFRRPSAEEWGRFKQLADGVPIYFVSDPDVTLLDERKLQTRRGQGADKKGGRPPKRPAVPAGELKRRRLVEKSKALEMHHQGMSLRQIAAELHHHSHSTVQLWVS